MWMYSMEIVCNVILKYLFPTGPPLTLVKSNHIKNQSVKSLILNVVLGHPLHFLFVGWKQRMAK